ncbi:hypothetical protein J1N35_029172 [Gossypium stocksii]|uniref:Uncharacterized protein n=1 Tax=Gossypium stocksii TaxID=47602 RepID=A0A9D3UXD2_9ROSI|nr:hypothetical protein J1N35_029172 [Gossypium stocksii]
MSNIDPNVAYASKFLKYPDIVPAHRLAIDSVREELFMGQKFTTKEEFIFATKRYSMNVSVDYKGAVSKLTLYIRECLRSTKDYNWKYRVSYRKAWTTKQMAMEQLYGDWDASYNKLQGWIVAMLYELEPHLFRQRMTRLEDDMLATLMSRIGLKQVNQIEVGHMFVEDVRRQWMQIVRDRGR